MPSSNIDLNILDPQIRDAVEQLNAMGITTTESCQGGPGHPYHLPQISFDSQHDYHSEIEPALRSIGLTPIRRRHIDIPGSRTNCQITLQHWPELGYEPPNTGAMRLLRLMFALGIYLPNPPGQPLLHSSQLPYSMPPPWLIEQNLVYAAFPDDDTQTQPPPPPPLDDIDAPLRGIVQSLYESRIYTNECCQGGPGHSYHLPWITFDGCLDYHTQILPALHALHLEPMHHSRIYFLNHTSDWLVKLEHWPELGYPSPSPRTRRYIRLALALDIDLFTPHDHQLVSMEQLPNTVPPPYRVLKPA